MVYLTLLEPKISLVFKFYSVKGKSEKQNYFHLSRFVLTFHPLIIFKFTFPKNYDKFEAQTLRAEYSD